MRILLLGGSGQLGKCLHDELAKWASVSAPSSSVLDVRRGDDVADAITSYRSNLTINACAFTEVDKAETDVASATAINADSLTAIGTAQAAIGGGVIHFSTDYVFDGTKKTPYLETDPTKPINQYGKSKLAGEHNLFETGVPAWVFRVSWLYSAEGKNFLQTMLRLFEERNEISIVNDQFGAPTSVYSLARQISDILASGLQNEGNTGIYNLTCGGKASWYDFALACNRLAIQHGITSNDEMILSPIPSSAYPLPAQRPANSCLSNEKFKQTFGGAMPHWQAALNDVMKILVANKSNKTHQAGSDDELKEDDT